MSNSVSLGALSHRAHIVQLDVNFDYYFLVAIIYRTLICIPDNVVNSVLAYRRVE